MIRYSVTFADPDNTLLTDVSPLFGDVINPMWVQGNKAIGSNDGSNLTALTGLSVVADQWAEVVFGPVDAGAILVYPGPCVRCGAPGSGNGYAYFASNPGGSFILRYAGGVFTAIASDGQAPNLGDTLALWAVGNVLTPYLNGVPATMGPVVDSLYAGGFLGLGSFRWTPDIGMVSFSAGDFLSAAPAGMMPSWVPGL